MMRIGEVVPVTDDLRVKAEEQIFKVAIPGSGVITGSFKSVEELREFHDIDTERGGEAGD